MSSSNRLVQINIDTAEEIEKLHGIGRKLAERIVSYRSTYRYFKNPEDLAKVNGISLQLATAISPHIDWRVPGEQVDHQERIWFAPIFILLPLLLLLWSIRNLLPDVSESISEVQRGIPDAWVFLLIRIAVLVSMLAISLGMICFAVSYLTLDLKLAGKLRRINYYFVGLFVLGGVISGIGHAINYTIHDSWMSLFSNEGYLFGITGFLVVAFGALPFLFVIWRPKLATSPFLARLFDISLVLGALVIVWTIWQNPLDQPLWTLPISGLLGGIFIAVGLISIQNGHSFYYELAAIILHVQPQADDLSVWKKWINARLPDPEQQQALKKALEEMHPRSRSNTSIYGVVLTAGGSILMNVLSVVVRRFTENVLNKYF